MQIFEATKVEGHKIELKSVADIEKLMAVIESETNFILRWMEESVMYSKLIIATNILSKVKNGEIDITAKETIMMIKGDESND